MSGEGKAFACSVGIHCLVFIFAFALMRSTVPLPMVLRIDFSIEESKETALVAGPMGEPAHKEVIGKSNRPALGSVARSPVSPAQAVARKPVSEGKPGAVTEDGVGVIVPPGPDHSAEPDIGRAGSLPGTAARGPGGTGPSSSGSFGSTGSKPSSGSGTGMEQAKKRYVKEHFEGIRSTIMSRLIYPRMARKMGWAGTVKVSFLVNEDGTVNNVKVIATSGYEMLDANAVETVKCGSPLPRPPVAAEITLPITYSLY